jgi:hypothetical protein
MYSIISATIATKMSQKNKRDFCCEDCDYNTCNKYDYAKHIRTIKHISKKCYMTSENLLPENPHYVCWCGVSYKHSSSYYRHKKLCAYVEKHESDNSIRLDVVSEERMPDQTQPGCIDQITDVNSSSLPILVRSLLKENREFKQLMLEQSKQMIEICKEGRIINHTTNHHNNQKFNLNFFLNTTCKDAINMSDFIQTIEVQMNELENIGHEGYVAGMTDIILSRIKDLDVSKRPVHCTDLKREIMYIKDQNEWNKDTTEKSYLRKAIAMVSKKNYGKTMEWRERNPECLEVGSPKYDFCFKMMRNVLGDFEDIQIRLDNKIIKSLAKEVLVDR